MDNDKIFTVTITGADNEVREFISDCVLVLAHNAKEDKDEECGFNMSFNSAGDFLSELMLLISMDNAKKQILDSDDRLKAAYEKAITAEGGNGNQ